VRQPMFQETPRDSVNTFEGENSRANQSEI
jgi:hypothetical protein